MQARGVSLWLTPEGPEAQAVGAIVSELSCRFGTPVFSPHVTLLAGLALHPEAVVGRCRELARGLHPFSLRFLGVQRGADFFRTLYVLASPDLPILDARQRAESLFPAHPRESFMPHLSLLYGALPAETAAPAGGRGGVVVAPRRCCCRRSRWSRPRVPSPPGAASRACRSAPPEARADRTVGRGAFTFVNTFPLTLVFALC